MAEMTFQIDPAFEAGSRPLGELPLSHVRVQTDARWPWLILIPRQAGAREIEDLAPADRARLMEEIILAGAAVRALGQATGFDVAKLNVGALGNITPQLHIHIVGRRPGDAAWPGPVWGVGTAETYAPQVLAAGRAAAKETLGL